MMARLLSALASRLRPVSLQARLAWRLGAILLGSVGVAATGLAWMAVNAIDSLDDRALQAQAEDISRHISRDTDGRIRVALPESLANAYVQSGGAYFYVVYGPDGRPVAASSQEAPNLIAGRLPLNGEARLFTIPGAGPFSHFNAYQAQIGDLRIAVAQSAFHEDVLADSLISEFLEVIGWWVIPVIFLSLFVGVATIRRGLAPLNDISARAAAIGPEATGVRLPEDDLPREIRPLVAAFNRALDRLARGFDVQRRFTADVAHELRTPLAVLSARVDTLPNDAQTAALRRDVQRMTRIVEQLLRVARLEAETIDLNDVDLRAIAAEAVAALAPLAIRRGRDIALTGADRPVLARGNAPVLVSALMNLVENALAHTAPGTTVKVDVDPAGVIRVSDRGPGIPEAERPLVFKRFWRRPGTQIAGAGLGLAIVAETMRAHGGSVTVAQRPGGGACFALQFRDAVAARGPANAGAQARTARSA